MGGKGGREVRDGVEGGREGGGERGREYKRQCSLQPSLFARALPSLPPEARVPSSPPSLPLILFKTL